MNVPSPLRLLKGGSGACLFFLIVFGLFFSPVIFGHRFLAPEDGRIESLPNFYAAHALWTDQFFCGWPLCADLVNQCFNPVSRLLSHLPNGWNCFVILPYVLAGTFMYMLAFELARSRLAASIAAIAYALSGMLILEANHVLILNGAACLPLFLLSIEKQSKVPSVNWIIIGAAAIGFAFVSAHTQVVLYSLVLGGAYALYKVWAANDKRQRVLKKLCWLFGSGIGLGAVQILPAVELLKNSIRSSFSYNLASAGAIHPMQLVGLVFPFFLGSQNASFFGIPYFGGPVQPPLMCYLGILPLILFPNSFFLLREKPALRFWVTAAVVLFLLSLGNTTPLSEVLYHLPGFGSVRRQHRWLLPCLAAVAICCAYVVKSIETRTLRNKAVICTLLAELSLVVVTLAGMNHITYVLAPQAATRGFAGISFMPWSNPALGCQIAIVCITLILFFFWRTAPRSKVRQLLLLSALLGDLVFQGWFCNWRSEVVREEYLFPPEHAHTYSDLLAQSHQRMLPLRGASASRDELPPCISRNWKVPSAGGYSAIMLDRYANLTSMTEGGFLMVPWHFSAQDRTFDILAIKYFFVPRGDQHLVGLLGVGGVPVFKHIDTAGNADIFENTRAMPRCWLTYKTVTLPPQQILTTIKTGQLPDGSIFLPTSTALVEQPLHELPTDDRQTMDAGKARIITCADEDITIETQTERPAMLVLSDTYYPGWNAAVDGHSAPIHQTDYVLRGVFVPAGKHTVSFNYSPTSFAIGSIISGICLAGLSFIALLRTITYFLMLKWKDAFK